MLWKKLENAGYTVTLCVYKGNDGNKLYSVTVATETGEKKFQKLGFTSEEEGMQTACDELLGNE